MRLLGHNIYTRLVPKRAEQILLDRVHYENYFLLVNVLTIKTFTGAVNVTFLYSVWLSTTFLQWSMTRHLRDRSMLHAMYFFSHFFASIDCKFTLMPVATFISSVTLGLHTRGTCPVEEFVGRLESLKCTHAVGGTCPKPVHTTGQSQFEMTSLRNLWQVPCSKSLDEAWLFKRRVFFSEPSPLVCADLHINSFVLIVFSRVYNKLKVKTESNGPRTKMLLVYVGAGDIISWSAKNRNTKTITARLENLLVKIWFPWKRQVTWKVTCHIKLLPDKF